LRTSETDLLERLPLASSEWSYAAVWNRNDAVTDNLNRATTLGSYTCVNDILAIASC
jgi:hypothetical protein